MREMNLLVWMTQLGLSLAVPLGSFIFLGYWLHYHVGWGHWALIAGILLGVISGIRSLWESLRIMSRMAPKDPDSEQQAFNDHL